MSLLTCKDIRERQNTLMTDTYVSNTKHNVRYLYENLNSNYSFETAKIIFENWKGLADTEIEAFDKVLEVFGIVCNNDNPSNIIHAASLIEGRTIRRLRDAKATRHLNNYKLGKFKIQNTKAQNHNNDNNNAVSTALKNKGHLPNTLHPNRKYKRDIYGNKIGEIQKKPNEDDNNKKEEAIKEAFSILEYSTWRNDQCDRVINNHNKLTKKFDMESKVRSCGLSEHSMQDCIYELCEFIDTYDIAFGIKYNIALENISYLFNKNCVKVTDKFLLETITDYFLLSREETTDNNIHDIQYILNNSKFYTNEDVNYILQMFRDDSDLDFEDDLDKIIHESMDKGEIKRILNDFKKSNKKTIEKFKSCITRIFVKPPELIIRELPDIFGVIRTCMVLGMFLVNPVVGLIGTITGLFLKMEINRKEMAKVIDSYYKEKKKYHDKMKKTEDEKTKEKYKKIIEKLDSDISKLEDYEDDLYSDEANDKRREERYAKQAEFDDDGNDDFDFDFDMDFDLEESNQIDIVEKMAVLFESAVYNIDDIMNTIRNNIDNATSEDIYQLSESVKLCNNIFDCPEYINILEDALISARAVSGLQKYEKIDAIRISIDEVSKVKYDHLLNSNDQAPIELVYENLLYQTEVVGDTLEYFTRGGLNEAADKTNDKGLSFMSKLKIAKENLKRTALKLKDKDRELSQKLDTNVEMFSKSAKNAMISENREAIIKGKLLPSASKCIHLAAATGLAWLVNPAIAVIGVLGYIGTSKSLQAKERRLIFDEIEVEIKMCDKYLRLAEDKNDMQAVRNIMQTKRSLERQRQRLRNGMKTEFKNVNKASIPNKPFSPEYDHDDN